MRSIVGSAIVVTLGLFVGSSASADMISKTRYQVGLSAKALKYDGEIGGIGNLAIGWYLTQKLPIYMGLSGGYGRLPYRTGDDRMVQGGLLLGMESVAKGIVLGFGAEAGGAILNHERLSSYSVTIEPQAYTGLVIGDGWRFVLGGGYLHIGSELSRYSGAVVGVRLVRKVETTYSVRGLND